MTNPTLEDKVEMYENLLHKIQLYREVTLDGQVLTKLLDNIGSWSYAHRAGNGVYSDKEQDEMINRAFYKLIDTKEVTAAVSEERA